MEKLILSLGLIGVKPILTRLRAEMRLSFINAGAAMDKVEIKSWICTLGCCQAFLPCITSQKRSD
ncbi:hypothetical protein [Peribacillus frigoritolerans]|uniref:hypothetical protein n=1 Tax=Peribacillus frigoritolerans TaxID=450367 RepID=UPI0010592479|nr:hypothetical protein [Peribacillus frigoritolerans]TDL80883.1 hypothetical protein E2R53_12945 [Peribacillus frigoritolerans]